MLLLLLLLVCCWRANVLVDVVGLLAMVRLLVMVGLLLVGLLLVGLLLVMELRLLLLKRSRGLQVMARNRLGLS